MCWVPEIWHSAFEQSFTYNGSIWWHCCLGEVLLMCCLIENTPRLHLHCVMKVKALLTGKIVLKYFLRILTYPFYNIYKNTIFSVVWAVLLSFEQIQMQWGMLSSLVILAWYLISLGVYSPSHFCPHFIWFIHSDITDVNYISFKHHYGMFGTAYHNIHVFFTNLYTVTSQKNTGEKDFQGSSRYKKKRMEHYTKGYKLYWRVG